MINEYKNLLVNFVTNHKKGLKILVLVLIVGIMGLRGVMQIPRINAGKQEIARLEKQIEYEEQRQLEVEVLSDRSNTDEYIEKIASERLGLIKSNAKIFIDVSGEQQ